MLIGLKITGKKTCFKARETRTLTWRLRLDIASLRSIKKVPGAETIIEDVRYETSFRKQESQRNIEFTARV